MPVVVRATGAIISGVLLAIAFPPWDLEWAVWVALAPLFLVLATRTPGRCRWFDWPAFGWGFLTGAVFFLCSLFWITTVSALGWGVLCLYLALYPAVWAALAASFIRHTRPNVEAPKLAAPRATPWRARIARWASPFLFSRPNLMLALCCAAAWVALEWLRGLVFSGFGWNTLGVALVSNLPLIQIAEFTGAGGVSFLVALVNVVLSVTLVRLAGEAVSGRVRAHFDFTLTMLALVLAFIFGINRISGPEPVDAVKLRVSVVQPNIPLKERRSRDPEAIDRILDLFYDLTGAAAATDPHLVLWPESAIPGGLLMHQENYDFTLGAMALGKFALLTGTLDANTRGEYNAAALVQPGGAEPQMYHKLHLVPFGEYVPFRASFPFFAWVVGDQVPDDFDAGERPVVFRMDAPSVGLGPLICFEDTLGRLARRFVTDGADVLVNVTNDAWFLDSAGSRQHLENAILRTVENRRPLLRAANTGVSAFIDSNGRVQNILDGENGSTFARGTLFGVVLVAPDARLTFYTMHGDVFSAVCLGIGVLAAGAALARGPAPTKARTAPAEPADPTPA